MLDTQLHKEEAPRRVNHSQTMPEIKCEINEMVAPQMQGNTVSVPQSTSDTAIVMTMDRYNSPNYARQSYVDERSNSSLEGVGEEKMKLQLFFRYFLFHTQWRMAALPTPVATYIPQAAL